MASVNCMLKVFPQLVLGRWWIDCVFFYNFGNVVWFILADVDVLLGIYYNFGYPSG
jgi:hypothetical protein